MASHHLFQIETYNKPITYTDQATVAPLIQPLTEELIINPMVLK